MATRRDRDAMSLVQPDAVVVASPGCGSPTTLLRRLAERSHDVPIALFSGLQIDGYPFLDDVDPAAFRYLTWHVTPPIRERVEQGTVHYVPARASEIPRLLESWGASVTLLRVSPPDRFGFHSLGPSGSYPLASARSTPIVIAEIDPEVPRTFGAWIHCSQITATIDAESPMPEYRTVEPDETSRAIARLVSDRIPERPTLQLGIGSIPEALTAELGARDIGPLRFVGMATDAMVDLHEAGRLDHDAVYPDAALLTAELMGSTKLMRFADQNPLVAVCDSTRSHSPQALGHIDRFVSVNSAVEVDLSGQVNAETVGGRQISGVGGSVDYTEAAFASAGGLRVIALTSTTRDGRRSRIVPQLGSGSAVTVSRAAGDVVVTEHGIADLRGKSIAARRRALLDICAPAFRDEIADVTGEGA